MCVTTPPWFAFGKFINKGVQCDCAGAKHSSKTCVHACKPAVMRRVKLYREAKPQELRLWYLTAWNQIRHSSDNTQKSEGRETMKSLF